MFIGGEAENWMGCPQPSKCNRWVADFWSCYRLDRLLKCACLMASNHCNHKGMYQWICEGRNLRRTLLNQCSQQKRGVCTTHGAIWIRKMRDAPTMSRGLCKTRGKRNFPQYVNVAVSREQLCAKGLCRIHYRMSTVSFISGLCIRD